jgi:5-methylcytosine-specific restriction endonuclease McrBC regulatory subunit McrC
VDRSCVRSLTVAVAIEVRERGSVDLNAETFVGLAEEAGFWGLLENGILTATRPSPQVARLHGTRYVGRALVGDTEITVVEKVSGSLAALLSYASGGAFKVPPAEAAASPLGDLIPLLIHAFLEKVRDYVSRGIDFSYGRRYEAGSLIGGTLNVARTVHLHARGMKHMAAFARPVLRRDVPKNKVALAAIRQIEELARQVSVPAADIATARTLAQFFTDIRDIEVLLGRRERWVSEARALEIEAATAFDRDLLALAAVVLSHESFEPDTISTGRVPRSWFVNLETLFEDAVRKTLADVAPSDLRVTAAGFFKPPIFDATTGYFRANPDLLVKQAGASVAVGDAKYKTWNGFDTAGIHHDLYQLLVHTAAHEASMAFLVYAHDAFDFRHLGVSATGADTWAFAVDVRALEQDLAQVLSVTGLSATSSP